MDMAFISTKIKSPFQTWLNSPFGIRTLNRICLVCGPSWRPRYSLRLPSTLNSSTLHCSRLTRAPILFQSIRSMRILPVLTCSRMTSTKAISSTFGRCDGAGRNGPWTVTEEWPNLMALLTRHRGANWVVALIRRADFVY